MGSDVLLQLSAGGIFAMLIIDRVFKFVGKRNGNGAMGAGDSRALFDVAQRERDIVRADLRVRDEVMFRKLDEQTKALYDICANQKVMCEKLDSIKENGR